MSGDGFLSHLFPKGSKHDVEEKDRDLFSRKGSGTTVVMVNETNYTLYFRDKIGSAYGKVRHKVAPMSRQVVDALQNTFFTMIVYAEKPEEEKGGHSGGAIDGAATGPDVTHPKREVIDTNLTIDTDQIAENSEIKITYSDGKFKASPVAI